MSTDQPHSGDPVTYEIHRIIRGFKSSTDLDTRTWICFQHQNIGVHVQASCHSFEF